jgi:hypothetical protein
VVVAAVALAAPGREERVSPARPSDPTRTTEPGARPLGYVEGQVLHLGPRRIATGLDPLSIDLTDDGAALTTLDGGIWFSDGNRVEQIGDVVGGTRIPDGVTWDDSPGRPREWVVADSEGSLLAWVDGTAGGSPELVVYDSRQRAVVVRQPVPVQSARERPVVAALAGREAYVVIEKRGMRPDTAWLRFSVDGGSPDAVDHDAFEAAIGGVPRALMLGLPMYRDVLGTTDGRGGHGVEFDDAIEVRDLRLQGLSDPDGGAAVELELPPGEPVSVAYFLQWLDDDQLTLWVNGDVVACQVSAGRCRRLIDADWSWSSRDMPLLPGDGAFGSDWALVRALRADRAAR